MASAFSNLQHGESIEVFDLARDFQQDTFPQKVNLATGVYKDDDEKTWLLPVVRKTEKAMADDLTLDHEYLGLLGDDQFSMAATKLLLGADSPAIVEDKAFGIHAFSGTGALRVGADFLAQQMKRKVFYYSQQTWENQHRIFMNAGFTDHRTYRYWDPQSNGVDFEGLIEDLLQAPEKSVVILHPCAHNPTGCDLTKEQWERIADVMELKKLFPFFDCAYQGIASGDLDRDGWSVRYFVQRGFELFCAQSFAKIFGIYGERAGNLAVVVKDIAAIDIIKSWICINIRGMYSGPSAYGPIIVTRILQNDELFQEWKECLAIMSSRIVSIRKALYEELVALKTPGKWDHIITQFGMFSFIGLTECQVEYLVKKHHISLPISGRVSLCGLNTRNLKYTAKAIHDTIVSIPA